MEFGEMKRNTSKEQFLHAFTSRGFHSVSWAFLFVMKIAKTNAGKLWCQ